MLTWSAPKTGHVVQQWNDSHSDLIGRGRSQVIPVGASPSSLEQGPGNLPEICGSVDGFPVWSAAAQDEFRVTHKCFSGRRPSWLLRRFVGVEFVVMLDDYIYF